MKRIFIPHSDLEISKAIFGTSRLGGTVERYDEREALAILETVFDAGVNCFDTADIYAQGNSERLLAKAFRHQRDSVVYATKGGYVLSNQARWLAKVKPLVRHLLKSNPGLRKATEKARGGKIRKDFSAEHLTKAVEASLARLGTDRIDVYQLHSPDPSDLASADCFEALAKLKAAGKIRAYGVSVLSWDDVPHCFGRGASWIQVEANLLGQNSRSQTIAEAADDKIALIARQAFGSGLLAQHPESWNPDKFGGDATAVSEARRRLSVIGKLGDPYQVILRYLLHHSAYQGFLFATTRLDNLKSNLEALGMPAFSNSEVELLDSVLADTH